MVREMGPMPCVEFDFLQSPAPGQPVLGRADEIRSVFSNFDQIRASYGADLEFFGAPPGTGKKGLTPRIFRDIRDLALTGIFPGGISGDSALTRLVQFQIESFGKIQSANGLLAMEGDG